MLKNTPSYPKVTVVSVSYNSAAVAAATIESVLNQDYPNLDYIIIDNISIDGTLEIIRKYGNKINLLVSEKDAGPYDAMNKGVKLAKGEWIWFMNMGDRFPDNPNVLKEIFSFKLPGEVRVIYGNTFVEAESINYLKKFNPKISRNLKFGILHLNHQSMICKVNCFDEIGFFETNEFKIKSDAFWLTKLYQAFGSSCFFYVNTVFAHYNETGLSSNPLNFKKMHEEDIRILKLLGSNIQLFLLQFNWFFKHIRIKLFIIFKKQTCMFSLYRKLKYRH